MQLHLPSIHQIERQHRAEGAASHLAAQVVGVDQQFFQRSQILLINEGDHCPRRIGEG